VDAGSQSLEWFQDDNFWAAFRPLAFGPVRWNRAARDVANIVHLLDCADTKGRILDLCCGPGRYAIEFGRLGFAVTAVDLSAVYLAELKQRCEAAEVLGEVEIIRADMRTFKRANAFDGAVCVGLSFGYLASASEDAQVVRNLHQSLAAGGTLVLEVPSRTWPDDLGPWYIVEAEEGGALIEQDVTADRGRIDSQYHFREGDNVRTYSFSQRLFCPSEICSMLLGAGFCNIRLFAGYDGTPLSSTSRRIIAVGGKPEA
jgi:SAM-dependent methyltransferase